MPGVRCRARLRVAASIHAKSGSAVFSSTNSGHDQDHGVRAGDGVAVVRGRAQPSRRHHLGELLAELRLSRERLGARIDEVDDHGVDVDPDDVVSTARELHGERQSDLPEGDDGDLHKDPLSVIRARSA